MNGELKKIITKNLDLIQENDFIELYKNTPEEYRGELSNVLRVNIHCTDGDIFMQENNGI